MKGRGGTHINIRAQKESPTKASAIIATVMCDFHLGSREGTQVGNLPVTPGKHQTKNR